jgi:hypothetical protein
MTTRANSTQLNSSSQADGQTSLALSSDLTSILIRRGIQLSGFSRTQIRNSTPTSPIVATFPITGGEAQVANNLVDILHSGGLTLRSRSTTVRLTDFEISDLNGSLVLSGLIVVNGVVSNRVTLFNLQIGSTSVLNSGTLTNLGLIDVGATLTNEGATALNLALRVAEFQPGLNIGTLQVNAFINTANGNVRGVSAPPIALEPTGATTVALSSSLINTLFSSGIQVTGFSGTQISGGAATFSITGGLADSRDSQLEVTHNGGLTFRIGSTTVTLSDFVITNLNGQQPVLTGAIRVNGNLITRTSLFNLQLDSSSLFPTNRSNLSNLTVQDVGMRLTADAANRLNQAFGISAFRRGQDFGTAQVNGFVNTSIGEVEGVNPLRVIDVIDSDQLIFAGANSTIIDATASQGNNRIYTGTGDDTVVLGANDRVLGGLGNDRFYVETGGGNRISGGGGANEFWIANNGRAPDRANRITDFQTNTDIIGIEGFVTSFSQVQISQNGDNTVISARGRRLVVLENTQSSSLSASNFVIVGLGQSGAPASLTTIVPKTVASFTRNDRNIVEVTGRGQQIEATDRNDLIDASNSRGRNQIFGERRNDTILLGRRDQVSGDRGNDRFFVQSGGNNRLTGGPGFDEFWIANGQYPNAPNTITDFRSGRDVIGIAGLGASSFADVGLTQQGSNALIFVNGRELAVLQGVSANLLSPSNFVFA